MSNRTLTVNTLIRELTKLKKAGLADATVMLEGCDCTNDAVSVVEENNKTVLIQIR